jgi:excinuclease UvrABC nuclease subunit
MSNWDYMFDARMDVVGTLDDEQLAKIPGKRGVVLLVAGQAPIQLITAANIRQRVKTRLDEPPDDQLKKSADLRKITTSISWKLSAGAFEADLCLLEIARVLWPEKYADQLHWKPPWFVHLNPSDKYPRFWRSRALPGGAIQSFGPFIKGADAEGFVIALSDAFYLCRDHRCLANAPHAQRCSYGQMNRCLPLCDGTVDLDRYLRAIGEAAEFASGRRDVLADRLRSEMKQAAGELAFERAAAIKARLKRLDEFEKPAFKYVRPVEQFKFLAVQPGAGKRRVRVFAINGGSIPAAASLRYPFVTNPDEKADKYAGTELAAVVNQMKTIAAADPRTDDASALRMGLISRYLFSGPKRRGLIVRWFDSMAPGWLAARIKVVAEDLNLSTVVRAKPKPKQTPKES